VAPRSLLLPMLPLVTVYCLCHRAVLVGGDWGLGEAPLCGGSSRVDRPAGTKGRTRTRVLLASADITAGWKNWFCLATQPLKPETTLHSLRGAGEVD
jgi:hypothetical protein